MNHDYLSKILRCTISLKNCCQNFLKISSPPSLGYSAKCLQKKPFDVQTEEFGIFYSGVKLSHFIYLSSLAWLAAYLTGCCLPEHCINWLCGLCRLAACFAVSPILSGTYPTPHKNGAEPVCSVI